MGLTVARVELEMDRLSVHLNPVDEILALHGSLHIPYTPIRSVVHADAFAERIAARSG